MMDHWANVWAAPTQRQSIAANAAAGALYGVVECALGKAVIVSPEQHAVAVAVAQRVVEHVDAFDREHRVPDTARLRLAAARFVAEHWRAAAVEWGPPGNLAAHTLCMVLAALDGESDPSQLGLPEDQYDAFIAALDA